MFFCCDMTAASMSAFIPTILTEMGYTAAIAQLLTIPVWITGIIFQVFGCWVSGRIGWRFPFILLGICFAMIGWIIQMVYSNDRGLAAGIRYFSLFAMSGGTFIQMAVTTSWMTNNLQGRPSTAVGTAMILGLGNCANFVAANVFIKTEAPFYPTGFRTGLGLTIAGAALCLGFSGLLWWHNQDLDSKRREYGSEDSQLEYRYQY
jgi:MFS family permease